jgi:EmrB/QacA subfamily drug resistance transporter
MESMIAARRRRPGRRPRNTWGPDGLPEPSLVPLRSAAGAGLIAATVLSSMAGFLDASVVNVAVPAIASDLDASLVALQWSLTGYLLTAAALLLVSGALADRYGRRRVLVAGLLVMLIASVVCAVAPSVGVLIAARVVQGVGAALVVPSSLALLNGTLRVQDRAPGIGVWAGLASLGTLVGPFFGGWLVDHTSWRAVFLLNVPLILAAFVALLPVPESATERSGRLSLDAVGALLAVVGLAGLIDGLTVGASLGWTSPRVLAELLVGAGCLLVLVPAERHVRAPMLKLSLFASRQFTAINVATVLFYGALAAAGYLLVLRCELTLGYTAAQAGAVLIPSSLFFLVLSPVSGALVRRIGPRWLMTAGILVVGASFSWLAYAGPKGAYAATILPGVLLWGIGLGLVVTPLTAAVLAAVSDSDLGEASAISDVASRLGGAILVALVPALIGVRAGRTLAAALVNGYRPAMIVLAGLCVVAAVVSGIFVEDSRTAGPRFAPPAPFHGCALPDVAEGRALASTGAGDASSAATPPPAGR